MFNKDYSKIAIPLACHTRKERFTCNEKVEKIFKYFKQSFTLAPILVHLDLSKPFCLEANALDFVLGLLFSHMGDSISLHLTLEIFLLRN
jgi:hypothetical protein